MTDVCTKHPRGCWCNAARAFAMLGLAIAAAGHVDLKELPVGYVVTPMAEELAERLRQACLIGQVTVIVPAPEPHRVILVTGNYGSVRTPYGVWLERRASFYGKKPVLMPSPMVSAAELGGVELTNEEPPS